MKHISLVVSRRRQRLYPQLKEHAMRKIFLASFLFLLFFGCFSLVAGETAALIYDRGVGQLRFAAGDLRHALQDGGFTVSKVNGDKRIELRIVL